MLNSKLTQWTFLMALIAVLFVQCSPNQHQANVELIEKYVAAVESKDTQTMKDLLANDYVGYGPSIADTTNKEKAVATWEKNAAELYDQIKYERSRSVAVTITEGDFPGEWVTNWAELRISYKDGRDPIRIWANSVYQIEDGQIKTSFTFYNEADALRQLGYVFIDLNDLYEDPN